MYLKDLPDRFFAPLLSIHKEEYATILFALDKLLQETNNIAMERDLMMSGLRRWMELSHMDIDVSDEEDYDSEPSDDFLQDNLAYIMRLFLRVGWLDSYGVGDRNSEELFFTLPGRKLLAFLRDISAVEDQSRFVVNTYNNLKSVLQDKDAEIAMIAIRNAHKSAQELVTSIGMLYSLIKQYYTDMLQKARPETLLHSHLDGYVQEVVSRTIFPLKVDDSVDRYKGPILDTIEEIWTNQTLIDAVLDAAVQTRRVQSREDGEKELLQDLAEIRTVFRGIDHYMEQLEERNNAQIRQTRQRLSYMLSMDTSLRGNIIALLQDGKDKPDTFWEDLGQSIRLVDVRRVQDQSYYKPRVSHIDTDTDPLLMEDPEQEDEADINAVVDTYGARFTGPKVRAYAQKLLTDRESFPAGELLVEDYDAYLMSIFLATESDVPGAGYTFVAEDGSVNFDRYTLPNFLLERKEDKP